MFWPNLLVCSGCIALTERIKLNLAYVVRLSISTGVEKVFPLYACPALFLQLCVSHAVC